MTDQLHRSPYWMRLIRKLRPKFEAALPLPCENAGAAAGCDGWVHPGQSFDIAHKSGQDYSVTRDRYPHESELGVAHRSCNRTAGGRLGAKKTNANRARERRYLAW